MNDKKLERNSDEAEQLEDNIENAESILNKIEELKKKFRDKEPPDLIK